MEILKYILETSEQCLLGVKGMVSLNLPCHEWLLIENLLKLYQSLILNANLLTLKISNTHDH